MAPSLAAIRRVSRSIVSRWHEIPPLCRHCGGRVDADTISAGERVGWCPHCSQVFELPLLKIPSWCAGVLALLLIKLQAGI